MKNYLPTIIALILIVFSFEKMQAQSSVNETVVSSFIIPLSYAYQIPLGDIQDEFGNNSTIGTGLIYKTSANWMWSIGADYIFGTRAKNANAIIAELLTTQGGVIGAEGTFVELRSMQRGFDVMAKVGKLFPAFNINLNSGIFVNVGAGYLQHKIRWVVENNDAPQLSEDYRKGYDRLTEGIALSQEVGLMVMSDQRMWNYRIGLEGIEAFTQCKRYNFDAMGRDLKHRLDIYIGIKLTWMVPLFGRVPKEIYYF